ncbi:MAG: hypothetical protein GY708_25485 [Actinomycetia bacterium]|nr:hypothetical protein [Actinomycetes bacterium]MCP4961873.1 hypothetical protein [Actinomycetes bacterium]
MKGKWAEGIRPRNFAWVIKDQLAVCERPGGYGDSHRRVRRQEEIIWLRQQEFDIVVSLTAAPHNLHNYDELRLPYLHRPFPPQDDIAASLDRLFNEMQTMLDQHRRIIIHRDELGDHVSGLIAGFLVWTEMVPEVPKAVVVTESIFGRQLGPLARRIVSEAEKLTSHSPAS